MILDDLYLVVNVQVLCEVKDYVCIVCVENVLSIANLDNTTNSIESISIVVWHYLVFPAPFMNSSVGCVIYSYSVFTVESNNYLISVTNSTKSYRIFLNGHCPLDFPSGKINLEESLA